MQLITLPWIIAATVYVHILGFHFIINRHLSIHLPKDEIHRPDDSHNIREVVIASDHVDCTQMGLEVSTEREEQLVRIQEPEFSLCRV